MRILRKKHISKVFCIGLNKTGTTSLKVALQELGFKVGNETQAKSLLDSWAIRDFSPIVKYCRSADAFQDSPFSFPFTFIALDQAFPGSKFILTKRDSPEQWVKSITTFHGKLWAKGNVPQKEDLQNAVNVEKGRPWKVNRLLFNTPEDDPYNKEMLVRFYLDHNRTIQEYFRNRTDDLLIINLSESDSYSKFCDFLKVSPVRSVFPKENITKDLPQR